MEKIHIQFTLFSAFYAPLIATMSGGFLRQEGLDPEWSVSPPGVSAMRFTLGMAPKVVSVATVTSVPSRSARASPTRPTSHRPAPTRSNVPTKLRT